MYKEYKIGAVIVAAGSGQRFGEKKQAKQLGGKPLYLYSVERFLNCDFVDELVLVVARDLIKSVSKAIYNIESRIKVVVGGKHRQDSALAGINILSGQCDMVCVHDAARPFVTKEMIEKTIEACAGSDGAIVALPSKDTVKEVDINNNRIKRTIPRQNVWLAQTPQTFKVKALKRAFSNAGSVNVEFTDESMLMESLDYSIVAVEGGAENLKITTQNDWKLAELILESYHD